MTPDQAGRVWEKMLEAKVRSLYCADMASRRTKRKQWILGLSFVLSSGAAVTAFGGLAPWVPATLAILVAALTGYSIAASLDQSILALSRLHGSWNQLQNEYERLWCRWYEDHADNRFEGLPHRVSELSETASTGSPWKPDVMSEWERVVYSRLSVESA